MGVFISVAYQNMLRQVGRNAAGGNVTGSATKSPSAIKKGDCRAHGLEMYPACEPATHGGNGRIEADKLTTTPSRVNFVLAKNSVHLQQATQTCRFL